MGRMFTPSNSDGSGMVAPQAPPGGPSPVAIADRKAKAKKKTQTKFAGDAQGLNTLNEEAKLAKKALLGQ